MSKGNTGETKLSATSRTPLNLALQTWLRARGTALRPPLPVYPPPPMTRWGRIWRYSVAALMGALSFLTMLMIYDLEGFTDQRIGTLITVDLLLAPVLFVMMALRRKYPLFAIVVSCMAAGFGSLGSGAISITVISVATRRRWKELVPAGVFWLISTWTMQQANGGAFGSSIAELAIGSFGSLAILLVIGLFIGGRRQAIGALHARIAAAEDIRDARFAQARSNERSSIAREMHDVLAHRIYLVALHAGALSFRTDLAPEQVAETAEIIRDNSHQALKELRTVLGVLRDPAHGFDETPDLPQPALTDLAGLIQDSRLAGTRIDLQAPDELLASFGELDPTISRNAYRVLQECLTNARKHAPHALITLDLSGDQNTGLLMECRNTLHSSPSLTQDLDTPGSGLGLVGMQERIRASGGTLEFGSLSDKSFAVKVWLPWETR